MTATTVESFTAQAVEWDTEQAHVLAELAKMEARAGAEVLADPAAMGTVAARVAALRARADLAGRAAVEARARAHEARVAALLAEADELTPALAVAREALAAHEERTAELRAALVEFTGAEWAIVDPGTVDLAVTGGARSFGAPVVWTLAAEVRGIEERQAELRATADRVAADPDYVDPAAAELARHRDGWAECVAAYRAIGADLATVLADLGATPECERSFEHARALGARAEELRARLALLPGEVEFYRAQHARAGGVLDEAEVAALLVELGMGEESAVPALAE